MRDDCYPADEAEGLVSFVDGTIEEQVYRSTLAAALNTCTLASEKGEESL